METQSKSKSLKIILIVMAIGIWVIALQNTGIIPGLNNNVKVRGGYVNIGGTIDVGNEVNVQGTVDVGNTVSISIDRVLGRDGRTYYFNNY